MLIPRQCRVRDKRFARSKRVVKNASSQEKTRVGDFLWTRSFATMRKRYFYFHFYRLFFRFFVFSFFCQFFIRVPKSLRYFHLPKDTRTLERRSVFRLKHFYFSTLVFWVTIQMLKFFKVSQTIGNFHTTLEKVNCSGKRGTRKLIAFVHFRAKHYLTFKFLNSIISQLLWKIIWFRSTFL